MVTLQSHGKFQAVIDLYTCSNMRNNCSMFLNYRKASDISSGRLGYSHVWQTEDSEKK